MTKKRVIIGSSIGAILIVTGVALWLLMSGRVAITFGEPEGKSDGVSIACGTDIVNAYNEAILARPSSDDPTLSLIDKGTLAKIATDIEKKSNYKQDPTCQTILFWIAVQSQDYESAKARYQDVKNLHERRIFADSNLRSNAPLFDWELAVYELSPEAQHQDPGAGAGDND